MRGAATRLGGRPATTGVIPGRYALSVGRPDTPTPAGWEWTLLTDVARLETGHTPSRRHPEYWGGDIPWIGITDATENHGRTIQDTNEYTNDLGIANSSARVLPKSTVCLSRTASVGYVVVMGRPMATSQDFVNWVCSPRIDPRFLKYVLMAERDSLLRYAIGTTHQTIYFPEVKAFHVCLPPIAEQRSIADMLSSFDEKIELNRQMNRTLQEMARALFKSWFVDFEPVHSKAEGRDSSLPRPLADLFPDRFEDSELGLIPAGWKPAILGDVAEHPRRGLQPYEIAEGTPYIALEHMPRRSIALSEWASADAVESGKFAFRRGEILFGKLRPYFHKVGVAPIDGVCSTDIVVVRPVGEEWFGITLGAVSSDEFVEFTSAGSTGTKMPRTSWTEMARFRLAIPPISVARAFSDSVGPMVDRILTSTHESRTLARIRGVLLPNLISGEIRMPHAERLLEAALP